MKSKITSVKINFHKYDDGSYGVGIFEMLDNPASTYTVSLLFDTYEEALEYTKEFFNRQEE